MRFMPDFAQGGLQKDAVAESIRQQNLKSSTPAARWTDVMFPWFQNMPGAAMYERQGPVTGPPMRTMPESRPLSPAEIDSIYNNQIKNLFIQML